MRKSIPLITYLASAALSLILLASCSTDSDPADAALPEGKYPISFTTGVEELAVSRAVTADGLWTEGDEVAIQIGGVVKPYVATAAGNSVGLAGKDADNTFYWQSSNEKKTVRAWYCATGYSATLPVTWSVKKDQSATGGDGYQQSDFLYAGPKEISFADRTTTVLTFRHQTARVVINIVNADAATNATQIVSVSIVNTKTTAGYTEPTAENSTGTWSGHGASGPITPKDITSTTTGNYLKSYAALVIPQEMTDTKFIAVTLSNDNTYYYTPKKAEEGNLLGGTQHTYEVTVKNGYLEVTASSDGAWGKDGEETQVASKKLKEGFSATDLKIGDYYYSDGTTSDGGYREYENNSTAILDIYPVLKSANGQDRTVIGIVMKVDKDADGSWADTYNDYKLKDGTTAMPVIRGYVLALHDANDGNACTWGSSGTEVGTNQEPYTLFCGYSNTQKIINQGNNDLETKFPATYHATAGYEDKYNAPTGSSGWFLPSAGQCWYWYKHRDMLLRQVKKATEKPDYKWKSYYWSSSEGSYYPTGYAWYVSFSYDYVDTDGKDDNNYVRSCLAF